MELYTTRKSTPAARIATLNRHTARTIKYGTVVR